HRVMKHRLPSPRIGIHASVLLSAVSCAAEAGTSHTIDNCTVPTPLGEFGYLELGSDDERPNTRYVLLGQFRYFETNASPAVVVVLTSALVATFAFTLVLLLKRRRSHANVD